MSDAKRIRPLLLLSIVLFLGIMSVLIFMAPIDQLTEGNTIELEASITSVEITDTGKNIYVKIYTEEYSDPLYISTAVSKNIDINSVNELQTGQTIIFRIESNMLEQLQGTAFGNIVSLKISDQEVFSLTQYNRYMRAAALPARVTGVVFALILLLIIVCCVLQLKRKKI